jgi:dUTP pyrophosphatase
MDLPAAIDDNIVLGSLERVAVPTGLKIAIADGFEGQVRPRSGLAFRHGLTVTNAPGTIDSDYRGELKVLLINLGSDSITIERGMRIAQLVIAPVVQATVAEVLSLESTERGVKGFGSTGV